LRKNTLLFSRRWLQRRNIAIFLVVVAVIGLLLGGWLFAIGKQQSQAVKGVAKASATSISTSRRGETPSPVSVGGVTPSPAQQSTGLKLGWSTGYYVGWLQSQYPPQMIPWASLTYLSQFSLMSSSSRDGSVVLAHHLTPEFMQAAVAEAHKHNVKILISVGGVEDNNFDAACNVNNRSKFVSGLVNIMQTYGYDGIDMDIEQDFDHTDFTNCFRDLRSALDRITPRPTLTMAVVPEWQAYMAVLVAQYVDQINLMSYWSSVDAVVTLLDNFTSRGIPRTKLGIGLGLGSDGSTDTNAVKCDAKAQYAINNGYGGVMEWVITDDLDAHNGQTPCLDAVSHYVP
jgi:hypothetical protein